MPKPLFRKRITAWMRRRPAPIPALWGLVDRLHHGIDASVTLIEKTHMAILDRVSRQAVGLGISGRVISTLGRMQVQAFGHFYRMLRTVHWYV